MVTRAAEHARELAQELEEAGAKVLLLPLVRLAKAENIQPMDAALPDLGKFDWLVFTSANAMRFLAQRGTELGIPLVGNAKATPHVAAVGPATANAAAEAGFSVNMVATHHSGRELAAELIAKVGAEVTEVVAYSTEPSEEFDQSVLRQLELGNVDVITLASPSAFHALVELVGREMIERIARQTWIAAIGPTTAAAMRQFGLKAPIQATRATSSGLVNAIIRHYQSSELNGSAISSASVSSS